MAFKKLQGWLERILVWQKENLGLIFIFLVTSCVILGKALNNSEIQVACLLNGMKTNLCLSYIQMRGRGPRDITEDIAKLKGPIEHVETIIKNELPEEISLCFRSCFAKRGSCPRRGRWRIAFGILLLLLAAISLFFHCPHPLHLLLWSSRRDRPIEQRWTIRGIEWKSYIWD